MVKLNYYRYGRGHFWSFGHLGDKHNNVLEGTNIYSQEGASSNKSRQSNLNTKKIPHYMMNTIYNHEESVYSSIFVISSESYSCIKLCLRSTTFHSNSHALRNKQWPHQYRQKTHEAGVKHNWLANTCSHAHITLKTKNRSLQILFKHWVI